MSFPPAFVEEVKKSLKERILQHKIDIPHVNSPGGRQQIAGFLREVIVQLARKYRVALHENETQALTESIIGEIVGYGVLDPLIRDPEISDILVNGPDQVYIERNGRLQKAECRFDDAEEILFLIDRMMMDSGRRIDHASPFVDFKLKGGLRVTAVIPPVASASPIFTIRKMRKELFTFDDLVKMGTVNEKVLRFLEACVKARLNILIAGSTGTGKTTMANLMIRHFIPADERIVIIEDVEELVVPPKNHHIKVLTRPANLEGKGEIDLRDLVKLALHLRPDRLMVGEIRGEEAFHYLHAVNTGHEGSLCTIHASNPEDALNRLEVLALMDRPNIHPVVIRRFLKLGIDLIVQMTRLSGGMRIVSSITEFEYSQDSCATKDIFRMEKKLVNGAEHGEVRTTGTVPSFLSRLPQSSNIRENFFQP